MKFFFALSMTVGFTTIGPAQKKQQVVVVKKHKPTKKVVYVKAPQKIIAPRIGTIVYQLPRNAAPIMLNKARYMKHDNVLYSRVTVKGKPAYKVVRYF